jgi:hypothetical protein
MRAQHRGLTTTTVALVPLPQPGSVHTRRYTNTHPTAGERGDIGNMQITAKELLTTRLADLSPGRGEEGVIELGVTPEDATAALAFAEAWSGDLGDNSAQKTAWMAMTVLIHVAKFVTTLGYGDTKFGVAKPATLNRVSYWAERISTSVLNAVVLEINRVPIDKMVIFENDKPVSSAPKCKYCKKKIGRGDLGLRLTNVDFYCNPMPHMDLKPMVKAAPIGVVCIECVDIHGHMHRFPWPRHAHGAPAQRGVSPSNQAAADALGRLVVEKRR